MKRTIIVDPASMPKKKGQDVPELSHRKMILLVNSFLALLNKCLVGPIPRHGQKAERSGKMGETIPQKLAAYEVILA